MRYSTVSRQIVPVRNVSVLLLALHFFHCGSMDGSHDGSVGRNHGDLELSSAPVTWQGSLTSPKPCLADALGEEKVEGLFSPSILIEQPQIRGGTFQATTAGIEITLYGQRSQPSEREVAFLTRHRIQGDFVASVEYEVLEWPANSFVKIGLFAGESSASATAAVLRENGAGTENDNTENLTLRGGTDSRSLTAIDPAVLSPSGTLLLQRVGNTLSGQICRKDSISSSCTNVGTVLGLAEPTRIGFGLFSPAAANLPSEGGVVRFTDFVLRTPQTQWIRIAREGTGFVESVEEGVDGAKIRCGVLSNGSLSSACSATFPAKTENGIERTVTLKVTRPAEHVFMGFGADAKSCRRHLYCELSGTTLKSVVSTFRSQSSWVSPNEIPGLQFWARAEDLNLNEGDRIPLWPDRSGNGHDAVQIDTGFNGLPSAQPEYKKTSINGSQPGVYLNGLTFFRLAKTLEAEELTFFVVTNHDNYDMCGATERCSNNDNGQYVLFGDHDSGSLWTIPNQGSYTWWRDSSRQWMNYWESQSGLAFGETPMLAHVRAADGNVEFFKDGGVRTAGGPATGTFVVSQLGSNGDSRHPDLGFRGSTYRGNFAEILLYDKALPDHVRLQLVDMLKGKYGIP